MITPEAPTLTEYVRNLGERVRTLELALNVTRPLSSTDWFNAVEVRTVGGVAGATCTIYWAIRGGIQETIGAWSLPTPPTNLTGFSLPLPNSFTVPDPNFRAPATPSGVIFVFALMADTGSFSSSSQMITNRMASPYNAITLGHNSANPNSLRRFYASFTYMV